MEKHFQLEGKIALITGSMSGMGLETAKSFLKSENLKGLILLDIIEDDNILKQLRRINNDVEILYRKCDVSNTQNIAESYRCAWNKFGYIHLAIHSAGIIHENNSRKIVDVNVGGVIDGTMWLWNKMRKDTGGEGGTIINISSVTGIRGLPTLPIYSATKCAVRCFSECLGNSFHYERTGVRVLVVCPGLTTTPMTTNLPGRIDGGIEAELHKVIGHLMYQKAESVAKVILEVYQNAASGTIWVSHLDLPAVKHVHQDEQKLIDAYFSK